MTLKLRNWKLNLLALIGVCLLTSLGCWQVSRGEQKKILLESFKERTRQTFLTSQQLLSKEDLRFYQTKFVGSFDNRHTFLLDNKIVAGKVGYEVYTPFITPDLTQPILIDRGFIPLGLTRQTLPFLPDIVGVQTITGMLNLPPTYVAFGAIGESQQVSFPLRVEYINLHELLKFMPALSTGGKTSFYPYVLLLEPTHPAAFTMKWEIVAMPPERHFGYAVQWFALALTLLILSLLLNREPVHSSVRKRS